MNEKMDSFEVMFTLTVDFSSEYRQAHITEDGKLKPGSTYRISESRADVTYDEIRFKIESWIKNELPEKWENIYKVPLYISINEKKQGSIILVFTAALSAISVFNDIYDFIKNLKEISQNVIQNNLNKTWGKDTFSASVKSNYPKKKFNSNKEGVRIVKVAAFCFAFISFIATAEGLSEYVFAYKWQTYMISFGIQSILFVFNLKLPIYFNRIGSHIPDDKKKKRKNMISYKWTSMQKLVAVFYVVVLISSSWFSYVFIVNVAYKDMQYIDANIILDSKYRRYLDETDRFVEEDIKLMQLVISNQLSVVQKLIPDDGITKTSTIEELNTDVIDAEEKHFNADAAVTTAQNKFDAAKKVFEEPNDVRWRNNASHQAEKDAYNQANTELEQARQELSAAQTALTTAKNAFANYKPSLGTTVHGFLVEILKPEPNPTELNNHMVSLYDMVIKMDESAVDTANFAKIVKCTQELRISVNKYTSLTDAKENSANGSLKTLKDAILNDTIKVPVPKSENFDSEKTTWELYWIGKYNTLEKIVNAIPNYSENDYIAAGSCEIINKKNLETFDSQDIADDITDLTRSNLVNINKLERAGRLLISKYPFLAYFSLLLAFYFDLASLLAGLFIYYTTKKTSNTKNLTD